MVLSGVEGKEEGKVVWRSCVEESGQGRPYFSADWKELGQEAMWRSGRRLAQEGGSAGSD